MSMETIVGYLDNMFARLPRTLELNHLKEELLSGMEEKYLELKRDGKSENEAIGIVISEFGTIARKSSGFWTGIGVVLCIYGAALLIVMGSLFEDHAAMADKSSMLGLIGMLVLVAVAVGMFIYSGMKLEPYKKLEEGFQLPYSLKMKLQQSQVLYAPTYRLSLITGVCLCVLSPVFIFAASYFGEDYESFGVAGFLLIAAVAVFLFVYYGSIQGAYAKLLEEPDSTA